MELVTDKIRRITIKLWRRVSPQMIKMDNRKRGFIQQDRLSAGC
nr:hypothetical protein [Scandinavium hiltneri]